METSYISTRALNDGNRLSVLKIQQRLLVAQQENSTGRYADVGKTLGARTTETVSLRQDVARLTMNVDTNASVSGRLSVTQQTLTGMSATAQTFLGTLIAARDSVTGPAVAENSAKAGLSGLIDQLNTTFAGSNLFGGENVDAQPVANYFGTPLSANRQSVGDAFQGFFGFTQDDPQVATIVPSQMQTFLDTTFNALFEEPQWSANWSTASDTNVSSRISNSEVVDTSTNANEDGFRKLAKAFTMLADLGVTALPKETFNVVASKAIIFVGEAIQNVAVEQAKLGTSQARVTAADSKMNAQLGILSDQITGLENVDPFEAATRFTALETQLQTAFALTARVQKLTILNFL
jgi:flagellar hook-associated protein 3 FlgL